MPMNAVEEDIRNQKFHSIYLLYGDEPYLVRSWKKLLKKTLVRPDDQINYTHFDGQETAVSDVIDTAESMPFLSERRVILCENTGFFKSSNDTFASYIEHINATSVLIFAESEVMSQTKAYKNAKKYGAVVEFTKPSEKTLETWMLTRIRDAGLRITRGAWQSFYTRTCQSMDLMSNECDKLISCCLEKKEITEEDVDLVTSGSAEEKVFDMASSVATKDLGQVMHHYTKLLEAREEPRHLLALIERQFRQLIIAREMADDHYDRDSIAKAAGIPSWAVSKNLNLSRNFTVEELKEFLREAAEADEMSKTGRMDARVALETLFMRWCN